MKRSALEIALSEILTREVLLREIFGEKKNTLKTRKQKKRVLKMLDEILQEYNGRVWLFDEAFVIYSFLKLFEDGNVEGIQFKEAWRIHALRIAIRYGDVYERLIRKRQQEMLVV